MSSFAHKLGHDIMSSEDINKTKKNRIEVLIFLLKPYVRRTAENDKKAALILNWKFQGTSSFIIVDLFENI